MMNITFTSAVAQTLPRPNEEQISTYSFKFSMVSMHKEGGKMKAFSFFLNGKPVMSPIDETYPFHPTSYTHHNLDLVEGDELVVNTYQDGPYGWAKTGSFLVKMTVGESPKVADVEGNITVKETVEMKRGTKQFGYNKVSEKVYTHKQEKGR